MSGERMEQSEYILISFIGGEQTGARHIEPFRKKKIPSAMNGMKAFGSSSLPSTKSALAVSFNRE